MHRGRRVHGVGSCTVCGAAAHLGLDERLARVELLQTAQPQRDRVAHLVLGGVVVGALQRVADLDALRLVGEPPHVQQVDDEQRGEELQLVVLSGKINIT